MTVVFDSMSKTVSPASLESMRWQDLSPTAEVCIRHNLTQEALAVSVPLKQPQVIYLRALLQFALGNLEAASQEWARLDPAEIPADYLYPPWRLAASAQTPKSAAPPINRYEPFLAKAVADQTPSPLVQARFLAAKAEWRKSLDAYLLTNPENWTPHEIEVFRAMRLQAPHSRDAMVLLAGALNGGKIPASLQVQLAQLIKESPTPDLAALASALKSNPALAKAATEATDQSLALRQAFASNQFQRVIQISASTDPLSATDEMALLTFLSAAQIRNHSLMDTWAKELIRRNPSDQTSSWIKKIKDETR